MMKYNLLQYSRIAPRRNERVGWLNRVKRLPRYPGAFLLFAFCMGASCERHTKLTIEGGNPPKFVMSGNGILTAVRVGGPEVQRDAEGEARFLHWVVEIKSGRRRVEELSPLTYGVVPEGFQQIYPENGEAPRLVEGERYNVRVVTSQANGDSKSFVIRNGKVEVSEY
jgi:hypothetical protein